MNFNRNIKEVRVYCECYEQGLYLLEYIKNNMITKNLSHKIIYTKPGNFSSYRSKSIISQLISHKDFDGIISIVEDDDTEHALVAIEFSTAVPTDDHIMQRFDVMYWSTYYQVPCLKISPTEMDNTNFGGGSKIKIQHEYYTTLNMGGIYYHIEWPLINGTDLVITDYQRISCPPYLKEIEDILNGMIDSYFHSQSDEKYFNIEVSKYKKYVIDNYKDEKLTFSNSTRIKFDENGKLTIKINRYGHAMDPERGMLLFLNKRFSLKPIVKFIVQRKNKSNYKSLYDGSNIRSIMNIIDNKILSNNNIVTFDVAFELFKKATNTEQLFKHALINNNKILINDNDLINNLKRDSSVINNLLHFGEKIVLNDLNDKTLVEINWNLNVVDNYYLNQRKKSLSISKKKLPLKFIRNSNINEDVVTYSCMNVFLLNKMNNIGVSYPGAQGDRKILFGSGVTTKREYVDIISIQKISENECNLFLQENKKKISQTQNSDIDKLVNIRNSKEKMHKLNELISKIYMPIEIKCCYIGVGGKESHLSIGETRIDYLIYIMINENNNIDWKIFCSNQTIFQIFKNIADSDGTLKGEIELEYPMYIVE